MAGSGARRRAGGRRRTSGSDGHPDRNGRPGQLSGIGAQGDSWRDADGRTDAWRPVDDGRAAGRVTGRSTGIPVAIDGEYALRPNGAGSVLDVSGTITVRVPLVGGQIELLARQMVSQMVERDRVEAQRRLDGDGA
ncbi:DUF2505 domain-containing protein [Prescottella defluvii]|nr:DUF2505 domain-containing protein [Prescottella defluvii]